MADDAWAVAALLHWMLVGLAPPVEGYDREGELEDLGVRDETLRQALFHALARSLDVRGHDLKPLRRELARWFVEHAAEESLPPAPHSQRPPPLPSNPERQEQTKLIRRRPVVSENAPRKRRASHIGAFALGAIGLGLIAGWVASALREKDEEVKLVPRAAPSASAASAPPKIQLGAIPVTGEREALLGDKLATCVAGYLPPETFASTPDVGFVCSETDPRLGAEKLRVAVVASGPKGHASDAMKIFARIGWYDMPAFAVVRAGCCPDAPPLVIDKLAESCPQMDQALREIGETVVAMKPVQEPLKKYTDSIHCELNAGHGTLLRRTQRPVGGEDTAFLELVKELETQ